MNYYILPKNTFNVRYNLKFKKINLLKPYISKSLFIYLNDVNKQLNLLKEQEKEINKNENDNIITIDFIKNIINPYEFIYTNIPGLSIAVSKVKSESHIFFELIEILNIDESIIIKSRINIAHLTSNYRSTNYLLCKIREEYNDTILLEDFNFMNLYDLFIIQKYENKLDLIICEFNEEDYIDNRKYINNMLLVLLIIIKYQMNGGILILKIDNIFYKAIIDIIYILSGLFDKVIIFKPSISNIIKGDRYLICKGFQENYVVNMKLEENILKTDFYKDCYIDSIIDNDLPYFFINKLEESNSTIGQQQLESLDQIINIYNNKNKLDKIETLKKNHILKCIQWCEKNQLPHNKLLEEVNIFLGQKI